jgi:hypothetical protein
MNEKMPPDEKMFDADFCRQKEAEYYAKARAATDQKLKSTYEAAAREYAYRVKFLAAKNTM